MPQGGIAMQWTYRVLYLVYMKQKRKTKRTFLIQCGKAHLCTNKSGWVYRQCQCSGLKSQVRGRMNVQPSSLHFLSARIITPRACVSGKVIGLSVCRHCTKIARSRHLKARPDCQMQRKTGLVFASNRQHGPGSPQILDHTYQPVNHVLSAHAHCIQWTVWR